MGPSPRFHPSPHTPLPPQPPPGRLPQPPSRAPSAQPSAVLAFSCQLAHLSAALTGRPQTGHGGLARRDVPACRRLSPGSTAMLRLPRPRLTRKQESGHFPLCSLLLTDKSVRDSAGGADGDVRPRSLSGDLPLFSQGEDAQYFQAFIPRTVHRCSQKRSCRPISTGNTWQLHFIPTSLLQDLSEPSMC